MFFIREQISDRITHPINIDVYKAKPSQYVLDLIIELVIDYIQKERNKNEDYQMGFLEMEYRCPKEFIDLENDEIAREWIRENTCLTDKGLIMYVLDNLHRMQLCRHKFIIITLKCFFDCRF